MMTEINREKIDYAIKNKIRHTLFRFLQYTGKFSIDEADTLWDEFDKMLEEERLIIPNDFIENAVRSYKDKWEKQNFKIKELWLDVVKVNAATSNTPHKVADEVIKRYKENFNIK